MKPRVTAATARADARVFSESLRAAVGASVIGSCYVVLVLVGITRLSPEPSLLGAGAGTFVGLCCAAYIVLLLGTIARRWKREMRPVKEIAQLILAVPGVAFGGGGLTIFQSDVPTAVLSSYAVALALLAAPVALPFLALIAYRAGVEAVSA